MGATGASKFGASTELLARRARPLEAVDGYELGSDGETIIVRKQISAADPYLEGHYPDFTIYPGVFSIETVVQAVRLLVRHTRGDATEADLEAIRSVRFSAPLLPGDTLTAQCRCTLTEGGMLRVRANCANQRGERTATVTADFRLLTVEDGDA